MGTGSGLRHLNPALGKDCLQNGPTPSLQLSHKLSFLLPWIFLWHEQQQKHSLGWARGAGARVGKSPSREFWRKTCLLRWLRTPDLASAPAGLQALVWTRFPVPSPALSPMWLNSAGLGTVVRCEKDWQSLAPVRLRPSHENVLPRIAKRLLETAFCPYFQHF